MTQLKRWTRRRTSRLRKGSSGVEGSDTSGDLTSLIKRALGTLGPGIVTGASDDDPSGIGTYAVAGAQLGFASLWIALFTFPLMAAVQYICAKIGLVSGRGLAGVLRHSYPKWLLYAAVFGLIAANTINVGADIGAVAAGVNLLVPALAIRWLIVPIAALILSLLAFGSYRLIAQIFKWLTVSLFAYIGSALFSHPDWSTVLRNTFLPTVHLDSTFLVTFVALLGTTISPYLFFWQATMEVEGEVEHGRRSLVQRRGATGRELRAAGIDVDVGMFFSNIVMYFIILATASTLFVAHQRNIQSAAQAAEALRPLAGNLSSLLLATGLVGSGMLAIPVLAASGAYALSEACGWKYGLNTPPTRAKQFYAVIAVSTLVGVLINFLGINPISALFWTAVINGFLAPPLLILIMLVANNQKVMGGQTNGPLLNWLGWIVTALMFAAAIGLVATMGHA